MTDETVTTTEVVEKKPTHTVLDNTDLAAVLADARGEPRPEKAEKPAEKAVSVKEAGKEVEPAEDDDGLTAEDRKELTEKMQKAIGKKHRLYKQAEEFGQDQFAEKQAAIREAEKLRREVERLKEQLAPAPKAEESKKPNKADFKSEDDYIEAVADWRADVKIKEKEAKDHARALQERQQEIVNQATARIDAAMESGPADFKEVLENSNDMDIPLDVAGYMQESEMFAELAYHLGTNPDVLENLAKLSPARQLVAIGKIESTLKPFSEKSGKVEVKTGETPESKDGKQETAPSTNAKPASKARPEPIKPIETGSSSQVEKDPSELSYEETFSRFQKTHKVNLKARQRH